MDNKQCYRDWQALFKDRFNGEKRFLQRIEGKLSKFMSTYINKPQSDDALQNYTAASNLLGLGEECIGALLTVDPALLFATMRNMSDPLTLGKNNIYRGVY